MTEENVNELVSVSSDRYAELEALEKSIPDKIKDAILQYKKESLKKLHERDKADPESVKLRMQRYITKNRDKINERRRDKRKKEQLLLNPIINTRVNTTSLNVIDSMTASAFNKITAPSTIETIDNSPYILQRALTVRFDD